MGNNNTSDIGYPTPEEAALANYPPSAHARAVTTKVRGRKATVVIETDPSYKYVVYCRKDGDLWFDNGGHN